MGDERKGDAAARQLGNNETECAANRPDLVHSCFHGSACIDASNGYGLLDRFCYCDASKQPLTAGLMCQFKATSICMAEDHTDKVTDQFCVNGGVCIAFVGAEESHPGCLCDGGWGGRHCEFTHEVLLDDALDLFQQRKAEIIDERLMGGAKATFGDDTKTIDAGASSRTFGNAADKQVPIFPIVGAAIGFAVSSSLIIFAAWKAIKNGRQREHSLERDYLSVGVGSKGTRLTKGSNESKLLPPTDVFFASRKKEVESDDGSSFLISPGISPGHDSVMTDDNIEDVEVLDAETSLILEAQFRSCEEQEGTSSDEDASSYDGDNRLQSGRITINSGKSLLSKLDANSAYQRGQSDNDNNVILNDDNRQAVGPDENANKVLGGVMSLDGDFEEDIDEEHYYV